MKNKNSKVLFFLFGGVGGAERMTVNIAKMLPKDRFDVKFVICGKMTNIVDFIPKDNIAIRIPWHNIYCFPRIRMANVIIREKPDFVFCSTTGLNILLLQVAKFLNVKCIVRNDCMLQYVKSNVHRKMSKTYKYAYRVIAQQEEMQRDLVDLIGTNKNHVVCLHNPVDYSNILPKLEEPTPYPRDDIIKYLCVGNYTPEKGHDILAEAFKIVHNKNPKTHLYLVGNIVETYPNYIKTKKIIEDTGLTDFVHFVGNQINPYKWMKYCDCLVLPSRLEGLPNVLLEAMYIGCPVVASVCVPVIDRMVKEGYNGYKVKPEQPIAMAEAMEKALELKDFKMTFSMATADDYIRLFE